jgi:hypothetical protein
VTLAFWFGRQNWGQSRRRDVPQFPEPIAEDKVAEDKAGRNFAANRD